MSDSTKPAHIIVVPFEAWGHVRPLLHLTIQLLSLHPNLHVTYLVSPPVNSRVKTELASANLAHIHQCDDGADIISRLQLIEVDPSKTAHVQGLLQLEDMAAKAMAFAGEIAAFFAVLFGGQEKGKVIFENKFKDIQPTCVIHDMFQAFVPAVVHQVTEQNKVSRPVSVLSFIPSGPTPNISLLANEAEGGYVTDMMRVIKKEMEEGRDPLAAIAPRGFWDRGFKRSLPGLPTMTDYELHPGLGSCPLPPQIMFTLTEMYKASWSPYQTGFIAPSVPDIEIEAKDWIEKHMGKPFLMLGFQYSESVWKGEVPAPSPHNADGLKAITFLDEMLKKHGPKSVIYISFGSAWFPFLRPDLVHHLIDTLISTSTPFLFAYATELFPVPSDLLDKVNQTPFGLAVHVAPQVQVLHHAATGFFLSHCGGNSLAEAIVAGKPVIGMPFAADQGEHIEILKRYKAGIDLKQVKCFYGIGEKPTVLYDGTKLIGTEEAIKDEMIDLWGKLKGELGKELYEGMGALRKTCEKSCSEGGASRQAMIDFATYF